MEAHLSIVPVGTMLMLLSWNTSPLVFFLVTYWGLQKHEGRNIGYLFSLYLKSQMCSTKQPSQTLLDEIKKVWVYKTSKQLVINVLKKKLRLKQPLLLAEGMSRVETRHQIADSEFDPRCGRINLSGVPHNSLKWGRLVLLGSNKWIRSAWENR